MTQDNEKPQDMFFRYQKELVQWFKDKHVECPDVSIPVNALLSQAILILLQSVDNGESSETVARKHMISMYGQCVIQWREEKGGKDEI